MSAVPKPPLYWLLAGTLSSTPGQGLYVSTLQQRPVAEPRMLASNFGSRPSLASG
jgi:hypothetical protein